MNKEEREVKPEAKPIKERLRRKKERPRYRVQSEGGIGEIERRIEVIERELGERE